MCAALPVSLSLCSVARDLPCSIPVRSRLDTEREEGERRGETERMRMRGGWWRRGGEEERG